VKVLLTGATGYIGAATLRALLAESHDVVAAVRSDEAAAKVEEAGATAALGDLMDRGWLASRLREADAAIHLAADDSGAELDGAVVDAVVDAFGGTGKRYVHTGGVWVWGSGDDLREESPVDPPKLTAWRVGVAERLFASDVDASLVAPGIVYGYGAGLPTMLAGGPVDENTGALTLVGPGDQHWTTVHVDDLADLYLLALARGGRGQSYLGASGDNPTVRELAQAFVGESGAVAPETPDAARERLGADFADALLLDQSTRAEKARALGWTPHRATLVEELGRGYTS